MLESGTRVIVTGGASGIGAATVTRFLNRGARVAALDLAPIHSSNDTLTAVRVDLSDGEAARAAVEQAVETLGGCDVLVNVVGAAKPSDLEEITEEEYHAAFDLNVRAALTCTQTVLPSMRRTGGAIVNVSSVAARQPGPQYVLYAASKGAIESMTRALAVDLGAFGIRVNAVAPGPIETPLGRREIFERGPEHQQRQLGRVVLGRIGQPEEVAAVIEFLASQGASYMTGAVVVVDGGASIRR